MQKGFAKPVLLLRPLAEGILRHCERGIAIYDGGRAFCDCALKRAGSDSHVLGEKASAAESGRGVIARSFHGQGLLTQQTSPACEAE